MRVIVTGANGFLGSHTTRHLLKNGHTLLTVSRRCGSLTDILDNIQFVSYDSVTCETLQAFLPDVVIHFAWDGGNNYKDVNSVNQFDNVKSGVCLLEKLSNLDRKPMFIGVGSFSEYGIITEKARETHVDKPVTMYGMAKSAFKTISQRYCEDKGIQWAWIRPCYVFGPNDVSTRLIPSVIQKLVENQDVVLDSCNVTIDYLHVSDFCTAVETIVETNSAGIFNLCSGEEYTLKNVLKSIETITGKCNSIQYDQTLDRKSLSTYMCGENAKIKSLGWHPRMDILSGIAEVVKEKTTELFLKSNPVDHDGLHLAE